MARAVYIRTPADWKVGDTADKNVCGTARRDGLPQQANGLEAGAAFRR